MALQTAGSSFHQLRYIFTSAALLSMALALPASANELQKLAPPKPVPEAPLPPLAVDGPRPEQPAILVKPTVEPAVVKFFPLPADWRSLTQTKASQLFRDVERRANATNPAYPIVILDDDSINLRPISNYTDATLRNRVQEILNDRGIKLRWNVKSDALEALGVLNGPTGREPVAIRVKPDDYEGSQNPLDKDIQQSTVCLVVPPVADLSSRSLVERWVGKTGANYMAARQDPGPYVMMLRSTWHEVWHCMDTEFYRHKYIVKGDTALNNSHRMHLSETFADVGATLTMAMLGHLRTAQDMADIRGISSSWFARRSMRGSRPSDESYYEGVTYYLTRAQDLVDKHISEVGAEAISRYTLDDIRRVARDITLQGALSKEEFKQMADSYAVGAPPTERVNQARQRMLADTGRPIPAGRAPEDSESYDVAARLRDMPAEEKKAMEDIVQARAAQAIAAGKRPEQGVIDLLEEWRREVHDSTERKLDFERKLYVLSIMLSYGQLDKILGRHAEKVKVEVIQPPPIEMPLETSKPVDMKPEEKKPDVSVEPIDPKIFKLPDFKLEYNWEPAPPVQANANLKLNLG